MNRVNFQTALRMIYPPRCLHCGKVVESDFGLCGNCWAQMPFASGVTCNLCGSSLMGSPTGDTAICDACILTPRPWQNGRAAMIYQGTARKLVLGLKHSDRTDIAGPAGRWIAQACHDILTPETVVMPVPLHWFRQMRRKYNQACLLASALAKHTNLTYMPNALRRPAHTRALEKVDFDERYKRLSASIEINKRRKKALMGKHVLIVDDVMTSGATLHTATQACLKAGALNVNVAVLARAEKNR